MLVWRAARQMGRVLIAAVLLAVGVPVLCGVTILGSFVFLPLPASLPQPKAHLLADPSVVYDSQGNQIAEFRQAGRDLPMQPSDIPVVLKNALISSEDRNFYHEGGVSVRGTLRALYDDVMHGGVVQGGSTITQQYVKISYTSGKRDLVRKVHEAILASEISRRESKDAILFNYLANVYFGEGSYGAAAAAQTFFRTQVHQLDASQAATLVGVLPAPSYYDPLTNMAGAEARRVTVLGLMYQQHYLSAADYSQALQERLVLAPQVKPGVPVTAIFGPEQEKTPQYPYFVDYVKRYLLQRLGPDALYGGGLRIQTTLDPNLQRFAEAAVGRGLDGTRYPLDMSLASVEPATGYVKALVGGRGYDQSQVNIALGGCPAEPTNPIIHIEVTASCWDDPASTVGGGGGGMPPGSGFKLFTLAAALDKGFSLNRTYPGPPSITIAGYTAHNAESEGGGYYNLRSATWLSINTVFVQLINDVGVKPVAEMAKKMGITSAWYSPQVHGLSYTLGVIGVSPLDMASAYGVLPNLGVRMAPTPIIKVVDATGKTLIDNTQPAGERVISAELASTLTNVLEGVPAHGTGYPTAEIGRPEAGKTGTAENCSNAWYNGYTPQLSTSVWMGHIDSTTEPMRGVEGVPCMYGGTVPAKTWADYMSAALQGQPALNFASPPPPPPPPPDVLGPFSHPGQKPVMTAGYRRYPSDIGAGGSYYQGTPGPRAYAPTTTTTSSSTTTTTAPPFGTTTTIFPP